MSLLPSQLLLVRSSFAVAAGHADIGQRFYHHLFALDPSLRHLFSADLGAQSQRLMQMIGMAVARLDHPHELEPTLRQLGRRHVAYGVGAEHYTVVGEALLQTLSDALGARFDAPCREAWTTVYTWIATTMSRTESLDVAA